MRFIVYALYLCLFTNLLEATNAPEGKKTVCLNMIVKNETKILARCLDSVKPIIDFWVIVDTGSTDGTQKLIKEVMNGIPGELHERPWINFAHNRNEALDLAKGKADYVLIIDADDMLEFTPDFKLPKLEKDGYYFQIHYNGLRYSRLQLVRGDLDFKWTGVVHEVIGSPTAKNLETLEGVTYVCSRGGARSEDPRKYYKDAELLEAAMKENPKSTRDQFYLAQSYRDAGEHKLALENYQKRADMGGWPEEVFWSKLRVAQMQDALEMPEDVVVKSYFDAYHFRPSRVEPLFYLTNYYRRKNNFLMGFLVAQIGLGVPLSKDVLFVEKWAYDYNLLLEYSICAYWIGEYEKCQEASQKILAMKDIPEGVQNCVKKNLEFANAKLAERLYYKVAKAN